MRKSLTTICAALLVAGLAACNRGGDNASDDARLNKAAGMLDLDNAVVDTSPDDAALNQAQLPADEGAAANGAGANAAAPANSAATGNRQ